MTQHEISNFHAGIALGLAIGMVVVAFFSFPSVLILGGGWLINIGVMMLRLADEKLMP